MRSHSPPPGEKQTLESEDQLNVQKSSTRERQYNPSPILNNFLNNFLGAAVFTIFDGALLAYLKSAQQLPENLRHPVHSICIVSLMAVICHFMLTSMVLMYKRHRVEIARTKVDEIRG